MIDIKKQLEEWGKDNGHPYYDETIMDLVHIVERHMVSRDEELLSGISASIEGSDGKTIRNLAKAVIDEILTLWPVVKMLESDGSAPEGIEDMIFEKFNDHIKESFDDNNAL